jgi:hypothetical protein
MDAPGQSEVVDRPSIKAKPAPADAVFPEAGSGCIGVLMLDTRFARLPGDIGHPAAFGGRARRMVVPGASPREIVASAQDLRRTGAAARFVDAARQLQADGARAITTSCGFLVLLQDELSAAVGVPVVSSSLLQLPALLERERQVGVLTIDAQVLGREHLSAAGVPASRLQDVVVQGVDPAGEFATAILRNDPCMDADAACADVVAAAQALRARAPSLRVAVLECTNMPPHAAAVEAATGLRLLSLLDDPVLRGA